MRKRKNIFKLIGINYRWLNEELNIVIWANILQIDEKDEYMQ